MQDAADYLSKRSAPLLTARQEILLFRQIEQARAEDATPKQKRAGQRARERVFESNVLLCISVANKYRRRAEASHGRLSMDDLIQEACLGLHSGIEKFDYGKGYKFSTYAYWWCRQAVSRLCAMQSHAIRRPTTVVDLLNKLRFRPAHLSLREFCEAEGIDLEKAKRELAHERRASTISLNVRSEGDHGGERSELSEVIADERSTLTLDSAALEVGEQSLRLTGRVGTRPPGAGTDLRITASNGVVNMDDFISQSPDGSADYLYRSGGWGPGAESRTVNVESSLPGAALMFEDFAEMVADPSAVWQSALDNE